MNCLSRLRVNLSPKTIQSLSYSIITRPFGKNTAEAHIKNVKHKQEFADLFDEITEIIGTHDFKVDNNVAHQFPIKISVKDEEVIQDSLVCTQGVCENACMNKEVGFKKDVSVVVHKATQILRGVGSEVSVEKRLEEMSGEFDSDVVDKVLKRCFKVPDLALRFFDWVKVDNGSFVTTEAYNTMIYILGEAKRFEVVEELFEEMEKNDSCMKDIKTWTILISQYGRSNVIGKVLLLFENMKRSGFEHDLAVYKVMLRALCNGKKPDIAMEFYKEMVSKQMEPDKNLYKLLLQCLAHDGDANVVHSIANDMIKISQIPEQEAYTYMLKSFCVSSRINEALEVIKDMKSKDIAMEVEHFEMLVKGMCRAGRITDALEIVDILKRKDVIYKCRTSEHISVP